MHFVVLRHRCGRLGNIILQGKTEKARELARRKKVQHLALCNFERQTWADRKLLAASQPDR